MRWKLTRNGDNMYVCCGCLHVRTGTVYLGISVLLWEVAVLAFMSCVMVRPDVVPPWVMYFVQSSGEMKLKPRHMMGGGRGSMMGTGLIGGGSRMMVDDVILVKNLSAFPNMPMMPRVYGMPHSPEDMPHDWKDMPHRLEDMPHDWKDMPHMNGNMPHDWKDMPHRPEDMPHMNGNMPHDWKDMPHHPEDMPHDWEDMPHMNGVDIVNMPMYDKVGIQADDVVIKPGQTLSSGEDVSDDDDRALISDIHVIGDGDVDLFNSEDKLFFFVMILCCIASAVLLIYGVIKSRPGYMMPFMGLQVFDFCATGLLVFTFFSYVPNLKQWIPKLPDSFPYKSCLMAADTDRLMLCVVLTAVALLVFKAYLMGMVWSCYKYLTQLNTTNAHRRLDDEDVARNPEDSELLLPPKYEDIVNEPPASAAAAANVAVDGEPQPPPYVAQ
jgi:hypothetical protein